MFVLKPPSDSDHKAVEEQRALIARILVSSLFEKSSRLCDFLKYICDRSLSGHADEVREQFIAHHVFGRPLDYNSAEDTIVRVTARQLRAKLREYFQTEGRNERWVVEIPKGGYVPVFRKRQPLAPTAAPVRSDAHPHPKPLLLKWGVVLAIAAVVLLFWGVWGWKQAKQGTPPATQTPAASPIMNFFAGSPGPVQIILSDSALVLMQDLAGRQFSLASYADRTYRNFPKKLSGRPGFRHYWNLLASRQISNVGDEEAGSRFFASLLAQGSNVAIRNARNMTARDFMSGNFILLGSAYADPWTNLFSKDLNFQFAAYEIRNLNPSQAEKSEYPLEQEGDGDSLSYARVALVPNLTNSGLVLLVAGLGMQSTEAASDFLLDPSSTRKLRQIVGTDNPGRLPSFELLLQTSKIAGTPKTARIVASRVYRNDPSRQK